MSTEYSRDHTETRNIISQLRDSTQEYSAEGITQDEFFDQIGEELETVREFFADYRCATLEVETRFRVLYERLSLHYDDNPIESIKSRVKSPESILRKLRKKKVPLTLESMRKNIRDIAGVRVICSFVEDIYRVADLFLEQDDVVLLARKDYIRRPKKGGYRSLHLIVQIPVFTEKGKKLVTVEVQLRTIAMDFWASLEHKIRYKKDLAPAQLSQISSEMEDCAEISASLDQRMQSVKSKLSAESAEQAAEADRRERA